MISTEPIHTHKWVNQVRGDKLMGSRDPVMNVFVKASDKFQRLRRIILSGIVQDHRQGNRNPSPQIRMESGPHWSQAMREWTAPWDPGEWTRLKALIPLYSCWECPGSRRPGEDNWQEMI